MGGTARWRAGAGGNLNSDRAGSFDGDVPGLVELVDARAGSGLSVSEPMVVDGRRGGGTDFLSGTVTSHGSPAR